MKEPGRIVLFKFPQTDRMEPKLRPALLIGRLPGHFGDWLICMISSQLRHYVEGFDEIIREDAGDFGLSGLKAASLIRVGRLAPNYMTSVLGHAPVRRNTAVRTLKRAEGGH